MPTITCPDPSRLTALIEGKLSESEQAELSRHVEMCECCQKTLESLVGGKQLLDRVARLLGGPEIPAPSALQDAIA
ncbi:MAG: zf-HC2 domain-containing protein [Planctomycetales bacterium]|nr:zf-HC2 domain-containing protein [Planctomycetales bacterium]